MSEFKPFRKESRKDWGATQSGNLSLDQVNTGALLRIADATEAMAKRHTELIDERDRFEWSADYWRNRAHSLERQLAAQKGIVTKLKKKLESAR